MMPAKICLNMIVKNETAILERCLAAAAPHIDCYVICDTGSTDDTVGLIRRFFEARGIPGEIPHTQFRNFEQARNEALDAARSSSLSYDYLLLCDADMEFFAQPGWRDRLKAPAYMLSQRSAAGSFQYHNVRLLRRNATARYRGVTHEYVDLDTSERPSMDTAWFIDHAAGSSRTIKYERDIALLLEGLKAEPTNSRYIFYLAQSYRDSGQASAALERYQRRAGMGGWAEEVWYSMYQVALLSERLKLDESIVVNRYLEAFQYRPQRAEPLVELARYYRENGARYALANLFAKRAKSMPLPADILFIDTGFYSWRALDEFAVSAYWVDQFEDSANASRQLLSGTALPVEHRARVIANLNFSQGKLGLPAYDEAQAQGKL